MSMENTTWYVVKNTPEKYMPQLAKLLCIVTIRTYGDFVLFNNTLKEQGMIAYKDSYHKYFKRYPLKSIIPISAQDFCDAIQSEKEANMYRIIWCTSQNALGETRCRDEERMENVILWVMANHKSLERLSAGYTVYAVDQEGNNQETIWNWQHDKDMCFGKLYKPGFQRMLHMVGGELHVYTDVMAIINEPEIDMELEQFGSIVRDVPRP